MNTRVHYAWGRYFITRLGGDPDKDILSLSRDERQISIRLAPQLNLEEFKFHTAEEKYDFIESLFYTLPPDSEFAKSMGFDDANLEGLEYLILEGA